MSVVDFVRSWLGWRPIAPTDPGPRGYAELLARYAAANEHANQAARERKRLRLLVDQVPEGTWGAWKKSFGEPAQILDQDRLRELLAVLEHEVPMKEGAPRLEVRYVGPDADLNTGGAP